MRTQKLFMVAICALELALSISHTSLAHDPTSEGKSDVNASTQLLHENMTIALGNEPDYRTRPHSASITENLRRLEPRGLATSCSAGQYLAAGTCFECAVGRYSANSALNCPFCASGKYQPNTGSSTCIDCEEGKYSTAVGSTGCVKCSIGRSSLKSAATCARCNAGQYQPETGKGSCIKCVAGTYLDEAGKTSIKFCLNCPEAKFSAPPGGAAECTPCAAGMFLEPNTVANTSCKLCAAGNYQMKTRSTSCTLCPALYYSSISGATKCSG